MNSGQSTRFLWTFESVTEAANQNFTYLRTIRAICIAAS